MDLVKSLEFSKILNDIAQYCKTSGAKTLVQNISFLNNFDGIVKLLKQSYQMKNILTESDSFPDTGYIDMQKVLEELKIKDSCIALEDMLKLADSLACIKSILKFFRNQNPDKIPDLLYLFNDIEFDDGIYKKCTAIIDEKGKIRPSCSPVLLEIYSQKESKKRQIEKQINSILLQSKKEGWSNDEDSISIRNSSLVIPVKSAYKRNIKGILHDSSQTGQTLYIEPEQIVSLNFELKELFFKEQREIHRILLEFSDSLRENMDNLLACYKMLTEVDFLRAKALYSLQINASMPQINNFPVIKWYDARHPVLESLLKQKSKKIVPLKIELNQTRRILVISGPNAGGKSVCLKTVALLQYMLQCGLLVPMKEISEAGIFEKIFLSIGDEQSLSDDLSTYSSHLKNLSQICEQADNDTLFLIDELGTGTDPAAGGAIAGSILEYLNTVKAFGIVTTHYSELKHLAFDHEGIINAAMLFDTSAMKPLYTLTIGTPGSSFAFEIAEKTGLSKTIIASAKQKIGKQNVKFEENLQQIEVNKLESEKYLRSAKEYDNLLYDTLNKYRQMTQKLENEKRKILNTARNQAKEILLQANKQIEHTIEEIKVSKADKQTVKTLKEEVKQTLKQLDKEIIEQNNTGQPKIEQLKKSNLKIVFSPIANGDYVVFGQSETVAKVIRIEKNDILIDTGDVTVKVKKNNVKKIDSKSYLKQLKDNSKNSSSDKTGYSVSVMDKINQERISFNEQIDVRGYRAVEVVSAVEEHIDKAKMLNEKRIKILHGTGNGILKTVVRDYLRKSSDVENFYPEKIQFGGEGITIAELKI